jgi:hypothetical protein
MDHANAPSIARAVRHDGWTDTRTAQFLEHLAGHGNVRAACARVSMSPEAAYRLRRRDALFARAWSAALNLAREASAEILACRAIDGIEEEVWYHGEVVGTRRRYDTRLLLAHLARLDALAERGAAAEDAARFDELLACIAGAEPPKDCRSRRTACPWSAKPASTSRAKRQKPGRNGRTPRPARWTTPRRAGSATIGRSPPTGARARWPRGSGMHGCSRPARPSTGCGNNPSRAPALS